MANAQPPLCCSMRFVMALVGFLGFANLYALRVNMSVAMVCMVNHSAVDLLKIELESAEGFVVMMESNESFAIETESIESFSPENTTTRNLVDGEFAWTKREQGFVLLSFFIGYMITQIPGGVLAERFGGKHVFLWPMFGAAICTMLCPIAARFHFGALIALRILIGMAEGVVYPSMHAIWSQWAPPLERSKLTGFTYAGSQIGTVITMPLAAFLCDAIGWHAVFYVLGAFGILWCILWFFIASNTPNHSRFIGERERDYINSSLVGQVEQLGGRNKKEGKPWLKFISSGPVWAIVICHTCANFGTYLVLTNLPTFMSEVLNFDIKSNGLFSAFPFLAFWLGINVAGVSADFLITKRILNTTHVRKLLMIIALTGQASALVGAGFCGQGQQFLAVGLITAAQGISGLQYGGYIVNMVDIAPRYAGTLFGISNCVATISGIVAPYVAAYLTPDKTIEQWRLVFIIAAGVLLSGLVFYLIFGSGQLQQWAAVPTEGVYRPVRVKDTYIDDDNEDSGI
uniref:Major facilitator superfamily (MFS) profile domain-containing protein n=1 Tax=Plectus sambesii TaxID=2011161 RepID=A0A914ULG3_9BILA